MGQDEDTEPNDVEFLDLGPAPRSGDAGRAPNRWPKWLPLLLAGILAAVVITMLVHRSSTPSAVHPTHPPTTARSSSSAPNTSSTPSSAVSWAPPVAVTELGHPLLGVRAGWELFGRGDGVVVRLQLARGRITRTTIPALHSSGPVSFIVGKDAALVRPLDSVPGYLVPDGHPVRQLSATLSLGQGGPAFPGPDLNHVWVQPENSSPPAMTLARLDSPAPGVVLPIPAGSSAQQATSDGAGYLLFTGLSGTYDSRPDGLRRITTGAVLAVGPTRWLVSECDYRDGCNTVVIDRISGTRRTLSRIASDVNTPPPGVISPDGTTAALIDLNNQTANIHLRDLTSGVDHPLPVPTDQASFDMGSLVWSPDSRWLFIAAANGHLAVLDARTRHVRTLGATLPSLSQFAIRNVPTS